MEIDDTVEQIQALLKIHNQIPDPQVLTKIESLLKTKGTQPLSPPVFSEYNLKEIDSWILQGEIGEGGSSRVYKAHRRNLPEQKAALKLLIQNIIRDNHNLQRETEILSRLKHPYIAYLIDSGQLPDGRPWLATEYVAGQRLDDYCKAEMPDLRQRLQLFLGICEATEFAHRQLVLHQDLKPANILINEAGQPKLLDFGIASLLNAQGTQDQVTRMTQRALTPQYASPEQVNGEPLSIASDIYSLGVILYEMLTGECPYKVDHSTTLLQIAERIRTWKAEPIWKVNPELPWHKHLKGDLWLIVQKALRKDPQERYSSVQDLANDIQAWLHDRPIAARPQTATYRLQKFMRRNKLTSAVALITTLVITTLAFESIQQGRIAAIERDQARIERDTAEEVTRFISDIFNEASPSRAKGAILTPVDLVDKGAERLKEELRDKPKVRANLHLTMGKVYSQLAEYEKAQDLLNQALPYYEGVDEPQKLIEVLNELASLKRKMGRYQEALEYADKALALARANYQAPHKFIGDGLNQTGVILMKLNRLEEAQANLEGSVNMMAKLNEKERVSPLVNLASVYSARNLHEQAIESYQEAIVHLIEESGPNHPNVIVALNNLGLAQKSLMRYKNARETYDRALELAVKTWGMEHPFYGMLRANRAELNRLLENYNEAMEDFEFAAPLLLKKLGKAHPNTLAIRGNFARLHNDMGDTQKAIDLLHLAIKDFEANPNNLTQLARQFNNLANMYRKLKQNQQAEVYLRKSYEAYKKVFHKDHYATTSPMANLANVLKEEGRYVEAEDLLLRVLNIRREERVEGHIDIADIHELLGNLYQAQGMADRAAPYFEKSIASYQKNLGNDHQYTAVSKSRLGESRLSQGRYQEASDLLEDAANVLYGKSHKAKEATKAIESLIQALDQLGKTNKAQEWRKKLKSLEKPGTS